jgi:hypothetical protein
MYLQNKVICSFDRIDNGGIVPEAGWSDKQKSELL